MPLKRKHVGAMACVRRLATLQRVHALVVLAAVEDEHPRISDIPPAQQLFRMVDEDRLRVRALAHQSLTQAGRRVGGGTSDGGGMAAHRKLLAQAVSAHPRRHSVAQAVAIGHGRRSQVRQRRRQPAGGGHKARTEESQTCHLFELARGRTLIGGAFCRHSRGK